MDAQIGTKNATPAPQTHFMDGFSYDSDTQLVQEIYRRSDESSRLTKSRAARVEFLTNVRAVQMIQGAKQQHNVKGIIGIPA